MRFALENAKRPHCAFIIGDSNEGWMLTAAGALFGKKHNRVLESEQRAKEKFTPAEKKWRRRERERILASDAYVKMRGNRSHEVTIAEALKAQGYATALFGKWHHGAPREKGGDYVHP